MLDWHERRHVRDGDEPSRQGIHAHRGRGRSRPARAARVPTNYKVLFLQGGATLHFAAVPMNLLRGEKKRRLREHRRMVEEGHHGGEEVTASVNVAARARTSNFTYAPKQSAWKLDPDAAYVHVCTNETIGGVEFHWTPDTGSRAARRGHVVAHPVAPGRRRRSIGLIYAGAQKNIGPAGLTIVIVREDLIGHALPEHAQRPRLQGSWPKPIRCSTRRPLTPSISPGSCSSGCRSAAASQRSRRRTSRKAELLYDYIDQHGFYSNPGGEGRPLADERAVQAARRSARRRFPQAGARRAAWSQLKGHRSVGGMRASIYNAMPIEGVQALVEFMDASSQASTAERRRQVSRRRLQHDLRERARALAGRALRRSARTSPTPDAILRALARDMHAMAIAAAVKAIGRAGAGTNNIPVEAMSKRGVPVFNAPGANANAVKELVIAGMLIAARNSLPAVAFVTLAGRRRRTSTSGRGRQEAFRGHSSCPGARWASSGWARSAAWWPTPRSSWA